MELTVLDDPKSCCSGPTLEKIRPDATDDTLKEGVRAKYAEAATSGPESGCGCGCNSDNPFNLDSYENLDGYEISADLGLGCGIPTENADLHPGNDVLDLGSGAGIDAFVARSIVGSEGSVTGVDFTPEMVALSQKNASKLGFQNVRFVQGDIEQLPFEADSFDRVISNCVLNLVPNKRGAFSEMYRVLRENGRFTVSDIVLEGELPPAIRQSAEAYAGCVSGAIKQKDYLGLLSEVGFEAVETVKERELKFTDEFLAQYASAVEIAEFRNSGARVVSITVRGQKDQ